MKNADKISKIMVIFKS